MQCAQAQLDKNIALWENCTLAKRLGSIFNPTWLPEIAFCVVFHEGCLFVCGGISPDFIMGGKDKQRTKGNVKV